jgi:hypothetical protein
MSIELDKIKLIRHDREEGKTKVLNSVFNLNVSEKREIVEHRIPGMEGGVLQDMGRSPVRIDFDGLVYGKDAKEVLKELRARFKAGKPMSFTSDLTAVTDITQVIIENLDIFDVSGSPQNYKYRIKLREYIPPKKKDDPAPSQDADAKKSVDQKADDAKNNVDAGDSEAQSQAGDDQVGWEIQLTPMHHRLKTISWETQNLLSSPKTTNNQTRSLRTISRETQGETQNLRSSPKTTNNQTRRLKTISRTILLTLNNRQVTIRWEIQLTGGRYS